jgi:release factor glutamine methyltransferase
VDAGEGHPSAGATLGDLLRVPGLPALEARMLVQHVLGLGAAHLIAHPEQPVAPDALARLRDAQRRRLDGEPLAYITGEREFHGLVLRVGPAVLIPRPETELLVDLALQALPANEPLRVLDLGTGSGAIAVALAAGRPAWSVHAVDKSAGALVLAAENARRHAARVRFIESDWFSALDGECFDLVVSNPPYVAHDDPHMGQGDLRFEPRMALDGGAGGFGCIRRISREARRHLVPGGRLMFEHGHDQAARTRILLRELGYGEVGSHADLAGIDRVTVARTPG